MKITTGIATIGLLLFVFGCQKEDYGLRQERQRNFDVIDFDKVEIADGLDVTIRQGKAFSVVASGDARDLNDLSVIKTGDVLKVTYASFRNTAAAVFLVITMPVVQRLDLSGAVNVRTSGFTATTDRFNVSLSHASIGEFSINANEVHIEMTGASEAHFTGKGNKLDANISGASGLYANEYPVDEAKLIISGASNANINVASVLHVSATDASDLVYTGNPKIDSAQQN